MKVTRVFVNVGKGVRHVLACYDIQMPNALAKMRRKGDGEANGLVCLFFCCVCNTKCSLS